MSTNTMLVVDVAPVEAELLDVLEPLSEPLRVLVIAREPFHVVLQHVEAGGRDDADLAHGAAQHLAGAPGLVDEVPRAAEHRAGRGAEPLGEADRHSVEVTGDVARLDPEVDRGVEEAGAVEVLGEVELVRERLRLRKVVDGEDLAALGVLEAEESALRVVDVVARFDGRPHRVEGQGPVRREVEGLRLDPAEGGGPPGLGPVAVRALSGDVLVAAPAMGEESHQVALGAARYEDRRFHPDDLGRPPLERVDGGVLSVDIVAHLCLGHHLAHGRCRHGHRVASKVDHLKSASPGMRRPSGLGAPNGAVAGVPDGGAHRLGFRASIRGLSGQHRG